MIDPTAVNKALQAGLLFLDVADLASQFAARAMRGQMTEAEIAAAWQEIDRLKLQGRADLAAAIRDHRDDDSGSSDV